MAAGSMSRVWLHSAPLVINLNCLADAQISCIETSWPTIQFQQSISKNLKQLTLLWGRKWGPSLEGPSQGPRLEAPCQSFLLSALSTSLPPCSQAFLSQTIKIPSYLVPAFHDFHVFCHQEVFILLGCCCVFLATLGCRRAFLFSIGLILRDLVMSNCPPLSRTR